MKIVIVCLKYELKKSMYYRTQFIFRVKQIINGIGTKLISLERSNAYIYILVSKLTLIDCGNRHYPATFTETSVYSLRTDLREMNFNKIYVHRDTINSFRPDVTYVSQKLCHHWFKVACFVVDAKPPSEPNLVYCQWDPINFQSNFI